MERRTFLKWATNGLGALFGVLLGIPGIAYLLDPLRRPAAVGEFKTVARLSELPVGVPVQVVIRDRREDAWTLHPSDVIGRVWLVRRDQEHVDAFTTICPHLGCSINFEETSKRFVCPCHSGMFNLSGERIGGPPPRGMDRLELQKMRDPNSPDESPDFFLAVKYQNFEQGTDKPIPKA